MLVTGDFKCSDGREAKVEADGQLTMIGPKGRLTWGNECLVNTGGFVVTDGGFGMRRNPLLGLRPA